METKTLAVIAVTSYVSLPPEKTANLFPDLVRTCTFRMFGFVISPTINSERKPALETPKWSSCIMLIKLSNYKYSEINYKWNKFTQSERQDNNSSTGTPI